MGHPRSIVTSSTSRGATLRSHNRTAAKFYRGQVVTTKQSTVESHTRAFHADSCQAAGLEQQPNQSTCKIQPSMSRGNPRLRANSGKQGGRDFNNRGGDRGRQPISFQSYVEDSEHTDQKTEQVASAPPGSLSDMKTKLMVTRQKVDRSRAWWSRLECEWFSRRTTPPASRER